MVDEYCGTCSGQGLVEKTKQVKVSTCCPEGSRMPASCTLVLGNVRSEPTSNQECPFSSDLHTGQGSFLAALTQAMPLP